MAEKTFNPTPPEGEQTIAANVVSPPVAAGMHPRQSGDTPVPGAYFNVSSTYLVGQRDIMASSVGGRFASYTLRQASWSADGNGDRIAYEGTVLQLGTGDKAVPRTSGTAIGILLERHNLRDSDVDAAIVIAGAVREDKCRDNGTFGTVESGTKTDLPLVQFLKWDV